MVGRDEVRAGLDGIDDESLARVRLKKSQLENTAQQVRENIRSSFCRLSDALQSREKQLLRQVEAIHRQQLSLVQSTSEWQPPEEGSVSARLDAEEELLERLVNFGRVEPLDQLVVSDTEPYRPEEYHDDVIHSFDKSLKAESDEFDVSSVIKRRSKPVCINLSCCESSKPPPPPPATGTRSQERATTSKEAESSLFSSEAVSSSQNVPLKEDSEEENDSTSTASKDESPVVTEKAAENAFFDNEINNDDSCPEQTDQVQNASKEQHDANKEHQNAKKEHQVDVKAQDEHPVQIQQWLQQILAETETEPIIHEIGQIIAKIPNNRLYREFPVET